MTNRPFAVWLCLITVFAFAARAVAASFTLADGTGAVDICISPQAGAPERLAATELADYIERMSGSRPKVVPTAEQPKTRAIMVEVHRPGEKDGEAYELSLRDGALHVAGTRGRCVLYAVYDLLERCGCRWLSPKFGFYGADAEVVPRKPVLTVALDSDVTERPALKLRKLYVEEGHSHDATNLGQMVEWMAKSRFNTLVVPTNYQGQDRVKWDNWRTAVTPALQERDLEIEVGGHGYQNYLNAEMDGGRLFQQHPEWFGLAGGKRVPNHARVFCTSNPEAVSFLTDNVLRYLQAHPEITIFDFWPPDGARWCECAACTALGQPEDRQARLVAHVLEAARAKGLKVRLECIAYAAAIKVPVHPPMDASVLIDFCPINQCFEVQIDDPKSEENARYVGQLQAWRAGFAGDISIYSYYRKYAWRSLPVIIPHYMQRDLAWYRNAGVQGISSYAEPGDWRTYEINHYVLARLAWTPDLTVDPVMRDFCIARFGAAAETAGQLYAALEDTVRVGCNIPGTSLKSDQTLAGYVSRLAAARDNLVRILPADNKSAAALSAMVDYTLADLSLQQTRATGANKAAIERKVDELVALLGRHRGEGVFVDESRVDRNRLLALYARPASGSGAKRKAAP